MTPVSTLPRLRTPGIIAQELGETLQRVQYVLRTPAHQAHGPGSRLRLYDRQAVAMVRHELNAIDARRAGQGWPMPSHPFAPPPRASTPTPAAAGPAAIVPELLTTAKLPSWPAAVKEPFGHGPFWTCPARSRLTWHAAGGAVSTCELLEWIQAGCLESMEGTTADDQE